MARRGRGEGTIRQRKDGRWEAAISTPGGLSRRKSYYGKTRREVADKLAAGLRDLQAGVQPANERMTTGAYLTGWIASAETRLRPATLRRYQGIVRGHLAPALGRIALTRLTVADVARLLTSLDKGGSSPRTVHHVRAVLRTALNEAMEGELVSRNVAARVKRAKVEAKPVEVLDPGQVHALLSALLDDPLEGLVTLAVATGARQGELLGLRWQDLDLEARTMRIRWALQSRRLVPTKTDKSRRTVHLTSQAVEALRRHRKRQLEERVWAGSQWQEAPVTEPGPKGRPVSDLVFTGRSGQALDGTQVTKAYQAFLARAGLPRTRFHDLRHTAASLLLAKHVPAAVVMDMLGHSTIAMTINTYSHVMPALRRDAADAMEEMLGGSVG